MKKSIIYFIILIIAITGCKNNSQDNNDQNKNQTKYDEYLGIDYETKNEIKCNEIENAKLMSNSIFVTEDGDAYQYGINTLFSNEQNCKKFSDELDTGWSGPITIGKIVGLRNTELIDNKMNQILSNSETNKLGVIGSYTYELKNEKEWYFALPYIIARDDVNMYILNQERQPIINSIKQEEKIISINGAVIKTDKGFYILKSKVTNQEECNKYADIECKNEYFIEESNILNKIKDKIIVAYTNRFNEQNSEIKFYAKNGFIYSIKIN